MVDTQTCRRQQWRWWGVLAAGFLVASGTAQAHQGVPPGLLSKIRAGAALAPTRDGLVAEGMRLFMQETFGGNGRTCATCHPPENNFTIERAFISRLSSRDPLFVAEFNSALRNLEIPQLMRSNGLILENLDGFGNPGVMRSVPHTLGLRFSVTPQAGFPLRGATGWSGDGAPGDGTLLRFAVGAVMQHFPKTLNRVDGTDFRLPTQPELDAMDAFQRFIGRDAEIIDIAMLDFSDNRVDSGRDLFISSPTRARNGDTRSCNGCHGNAGANTSAGNNNFDTGVRLVENAPACLGVDSVPGDGGFGFEPVVEVSLEDFCGTTSAGIAIFRGNGTMNTPPLIEAADTPPFFHNNSAATIEDAVRFYTSDTFHNSPAGEAGGGAFVLTTDQVNDIGAFLRALNALENIRAGIEYAEFALREPRANARATLRLALAETEDAFEVLTEGPIQLFDVGVRERLSRALLLERMAAGRVPAGFPGPQSRQPGARAAQALIQEAIDLKEQARDLMLVNGG